MGCGCKGQQAKQEKIVPEGITPIQVQAITGVENPGYTREDIIKIKDYLSSTNKQYSQKQIVASLLEQYFGDVTPDYCDQNCYRHIESRVDTMDKRLAEYEKFILNK